MGSPPPPPKLCSQRGHPHCWPCSPSTPRPASCWKGAGALGPAPQPLWMCHQTLAVSLKARVTPRLQMGRLGSAPRGEATCPIAELTIQPGFKPSFNWLLQARDGFGLRDNLPPTGKEAAFDPGLLLQTRLPCAPPVLGRLFTLWLSAPAPETELPLPPREAE